MPGSVVEVLCIWGALPALATLVIASQDLGLERRPHFALRVLGSCCALPAIIAVLVGAVRLGLLPEAGGAIALLMLLMLSIAGVMLVPGILFRSPGTPPADGDNDGGSGPGPPPLTPPPGGGDLPLPDAEPAPRRRRDHDRPQLGHTRPRRWTREPERRPVVTPPRT